ncbi:MAG: amidohydrolase [Lachnospiraceae bacterium]
MKIRFYNARVLTMEENANGACEIFEGEVWVEEEKIIYVGTGKELDAYYKKHNITCIIWDREIDCEGNLLMPGFKNAHTHSGMTVLRSLADDLPLQEWLTTQVFPNEEKLTGEDVYHLTKLAILEYLTSGITAIFDMYLTPLTIAQACIDSGMRCVQVGSINKFGPKVADIEELYQTLNHNNPLSSYILGFHAEYTCDKELLQEMAALAHKYHAPMYTHNSETALEVEECVGRYGMTPTVFLNSLGMFDYGGGGYHCVHMSEEDIAIFKEKKLTVVTNPGSNTKLASGIAPINRFLEEGIPVAIGTDGPASNNCLDMFREMFLVTGLAKLREQDAAAVSADKVLKMATVNGAHAMGLHNCDVLAEGKLADMIVIDLNQPNMQPINNIVKNLVYSGSKQNVKMTMIHGVILYEDGKFFIGEDPKAIYQQSNDIIARICK